MRALSRTRVMLCRDVLCAIFSLGAAVGSGAVLCGCGKAKDLPPDALRQVALFHQRYDERKFAEIHGEACPEFRSVITEPAYVKLATAVWNRLGKVKSTSMLAWKRNDYTVRQTVVLAMDTVYEKGRVKETFTFLMTDQGCTLQGYDIAGAEAEEKK